MSESLGDDVVSPSLLMWRGFDRNITELVDEFGEIKTTTRTSLPRRDTAFPLRLGVERTERANNENSTRSVDNKLEVYDQSGGGEPLLLARAVTALNCESSIRTTFFVPKPEIIRGYKQRIDDYDLKLDWGFKLDWLLEPFEADPSDFVDQGGDSFVSISDGEAINPGSWLEHTLDGVFLKDGALTEETQTIKFSYPPDFYFLWTRDTKTDPEGKDIITDKTKCAYAGPEAEFEMWGYGPIVLLGDEGDEQPNMNLVFREHDITMPPPPFSKIIFPSNLLHSSGFSGYLDSAKYRKGKERLRPTPTSLGFVNRLLAAMPERVIEAKVAAFCNSIPDDLGDIDLAA